MLLDALRHGGGDALAIRWSGPGIKKQNIPANRLSVSGGETLHDHAIRALVTVPGHEPEMFTDLTLLLKAGLHRNSAIAALFELHVTF